MADLTTSQRRSSGVVPVGRGAVPSAEIPSGDPSKYYIYSSKAGKTSDVNTKVLSQDEVNLDNFLNQLPDHGIIVNKPAWGQRAELDASDKWQKWMFNWDTNCIISITVDNTTDMNIQAFMIELNKPWNLVFVSSLATLYFSFGITDIIPVPGIRKDGSCLFFGMDPVKSDHITMSVGDVFALANLSDAAKRLPDSVTKLAARLEPKTTRNERDAFWFAPDELWTAVRFQFNIDKADQVLAILDGKIPDLKFTSAKLICKKEMVLADTDEGRETLSIGGIAFEIKCSITPKGKSSIDMILALEVTEDELDLTFNVGDPLHDGTFTDIISWLLGLLPDGSGVDGIQNMLEQDNIFTDYIHLRRLKIALDIVKGSPSFSSVMVDIEVSGKFGSGGKTQRAPFLVTYNWNIDGGPLGSITGGFWNWYDSSPERVLAFQYEDFSSLQPITPDPLKVLDLVTLIPGVKEIPNIPDTVPTEISRAGIYLSQDTFAVGASIESKNHRRGDESDKVPRIDLGKIDLDASFSWGSSSNFTLQLAFITTLVPSEDSEQKETAYLIGDVIYDSSLGWQLEAELDGLYASTLCEFFDKKSADHVMPLLDSLRIAKMHILYQYEKASTGGRSIGSSFDFTGAILVANLELDLNFHFDNIKGWKFTADLKAADDKTTLGDILATMLGNNDLDLPPFLADTPFNGDKESGNTIYLEVQKSDAGFHFLTNIVFKPIEVVFAQFHSKKWPTTTPSKRLVKAGIMALPSIPIPLIGDLTQPFDEMYLIWVQDAANLPKSQQAEPGLTVTEIEDLNKSLGKHPLAYSNKSKDPKNADVVITTGAHFCIVLKDRNNTRTLVLDYNFKKAQSQPKKKASATEEQAVEGLKKAGKQPDSDGSSSSAPFKKKAGPLSISNLGLKYADNKLHIIFTATMELGPVGLSLIGFSLGVNLKVLKKPELSDISVTLEGLSVAFERPPLTIAGIIRHSKDSGLEYYAGGLIIGWVPYQVQAAGFYGSVTPDKGQSFVSVFVFARLDGPLVELEFAEISGVTGGFGYNSDVHVPTADQIVNFPFIKQASPDDAKDSAMDTLKKLTDPGEGGWFSPLNGTYWAAVGMKIDAFQLIALDAVVVVQFGEAIKLGIFAVASVDIPNPNSPMKFAHAELGIAVVVDFSYGVLKAEAQLSPNSYILHPSCHLTGGFALYYWFEAPHADHSKVGDFVFSMGGYHPAYEVLQGYPNPPRLGISWSLGGGLSITGGAYFAITPKACMGGGRLHAALHAGPLEAWFDAFADFLINYEPFHFLAEIGIDVGVRFNIDVWFVHTHISVDVGADLTMWGPPLAGRVHINLKVVKFDMNFGDAGKNIDPISLLEFYQLVLQADMSGNRLQAEKRTMAAPQVIELEETEVESGKSPLDMPQDEGHTFLAESGLMNGDDKPTRKHNQAWLVRGGSFVCVLGCKMAIQSANVEGDANCSVASNKTIYAKPMKLTRQTSGLDSVLEISITREDGEAIEGWKMEKVMKSLPDGLWGEYDSSSDPLKNGNNIPDLLSSSSGTTELLAGVRLTAPPPKKSEDPYPVFDIVDAELVTLFADKPFPKPEKSRENWKPDEVLEGRAQWEIVRKKWAWPDWSQDGREVQEEFVGGWAATLGWDKGLSKWANMPKGIKDQFDDLYVAAPLITV
ncbi:putative transcriptional activator srcap-like protein [Xylaria intraflava]|nr:putative transcriptional activator srcap-like protein [Xylaria intraflava]